MTALEGKCIVDRYRHIDVSKYLAWCVQLTFEGSWPVRGRLLFQALIGGDYVHSCCSSEEEEEEKLEIHV